MIIGILLGLILKRRHVLGARICFIINALINLYAVVIMTPIIFGGLGSKDPDVAVSMPFYFLIYLFIAVIPFIISVVLLVRTRKLNGKLSSSAGDEPKVAAKTSSGHSKSPGTMAELKQTAKKAFRFNGERISRGEFWRFILAYDLFIILTIIVVGCVAPALAGDDGKITGAASYIVTPLLLLPFAAIIVGVWCKMGALEGRLHDLGKSSWLALWALIPFGRIYLLALSLQKGEGGANEYGKPSTQASDTDLMDDGGDGDLYYETAKKLDRIVLKYSLEASDAGDDDEHIDEVCTELRFGALVLASETIFSKQKDKQYSYSRHDSRMAGCFSSVMGLDRRKARRALDTDRANDYMEAVDELIASKDKVASKYAKLIKKTALED